MVYKMQLVSFGLLSLLLSGFVVAAPHQPLQWPLTQNGDSRTAGQPRVIRQNDSICDAGSAQWTGSVPLGENRNMFFWYFESRNSPETAPLVVWLNGGPGASSLLGAFHERVGPCTVNDAGTGTNRNELSWTNFANMLFIDQPIGVGFSRGAERNLWAAGLFEGGIDFDSFLETFLYDLFPQLQGRPIHLAGESFGGRYCPVYAMMTRKKWDSIILFNALIDFPSAVLGVYHHFCILGNTLGAKSSLNGTACSEMEAAYPACEKYGQLCATTYDMDFCTDAWEKCMAVYEPYMRGIVPGGQNPYDDRTTCKTPPMCGRLGMEELEAYMNSEGLQRALGFDRWFNFTAVNMELNTEWSSQPSMRLPSTREIQSLLDEKDTPILVVNGNNDVIVNTEGIVQVYDDLSWSGHAKFKTQKLQPWYFADRHDAKVRGGKFKRVGKLALVTVDSAGHMAPHDQPMAVSQLVEAWTQQTLDLSSEEWANTQEEL